MLLKTLILACSSIAGISASSFEDDKSAKNGYQASKVAQDTVLPLDFNWNSFFFTNAGSHGFPRYQVTLANVFDPPVVHLTDLYCSGDTFTTYVEGPAAFFAAANSTDALAVSCEPYTTDPETAFNSKGPWATQVIALPPLVGTYNFTIVMRASPYSAGAMAMRRVPIPL